MNLRGYIENQRMNGENRLPQRTMSIPSGRRGVTYENFTDSDRVKLLNGVWKFRYIEKDEGDALRDPALDDTSWDDIDVPSMWQYRGYGKCRYTNTRFPFPYDPPYVFTENPVGQYRYRFTAEKAPHTILRFTGVGGAFFVWLNGEYVGFSKGSRIAAEFDVTDKLVDGENLIAVKVFTWSDAAYMENQDMLLANGIFRDVYLISYAESYLWDYTVVPEKNGFRLFPEMKGGETLSAELYDAEGKLVSAVHDCGTECFLEVAEPRLWNAEDPYLYELVLRDGGEIVTKKVGLRFSEIKGNRILINGIPITLKGVNIHDNNCHDGQAITAAQIRSELEDIKNCNLNAIRCSHYTKNPVFYEIASELGIYVMDEADCETHGCGETGDQGSINKDPAWFDAFYDRISRMYYQDKNETCINIWSLGNECGYGWNFVRMAKWLNEQKVPKPISANANGDTEGIFAFRLTGYMSMATLRNFEPEGKPVLMLEYGHAMGNSPGALEDIWNYIYANEQICGGYVWEYKSHGFYVKGKDGRPRYLYGGDFGGEAFDFSNFTLDGYHTSDGTPKPTWDELREVSAPVHLYRNDEGVFAYNTLDFTTLSGVKLDFSVVSLKPGAERGEVVREEVVALPDIAPHSSVKLDVDLSVEGLSGHSAAEFVFSLDGRKLGHKELVLTDETTARTLTQDSDTLSVEENGETVVVSGNDFAATFSGGVLSGFVKNGKTLIDRPMRLNLVRAYTDNDGIVGLYPRHITEWDNALLDDAKFWAHTVTIGHGSDGSVTVTAEGRLMPEGLWWGFDMRITSRVVNGNVEISIHGKPYGKIKDILPRIGVRFDLPEAYESCEWYGRGPGDSYVDRKADAHFGNWKGDIASMNFLYDVPQETGNREDCRRLTVSGGELSLGVEGKFAFSCHDFTLENLKKARHFDELERTARKSLYIDYRMRPLGSHSCGPEPEPEYELRPHEFDWSFRLK